MNMLKPVFVFFAVLLVSSCRESSDQPLKNNRLNKAWLNQLIKRSDSSYSKPYFRRDFAVASYYLIRKDSILCQVMKDSSERIRQVLLQQKGVLRNSMMFYENGQLIDDISLDEKGQNHGPVIQYYPNGALRARGSYRHGLHYGNWDFFDETGQLTEKRVFDSTGVMIQSANEGVR